METELAAVDQLEALQARALAEANSEVERQARVLAEHEVEQLKSSMQVSKQFATKPLLPLTVCVIVNEQSINNLFVVYLICLWV